MLLSALLDIRPASYTPLLLIDSLTPSFLAEYVTAKSIPSSYTLKSHIGEMRDSWQLSPVLAKQASFFTSRLAIAYAYA